MLQSIQSSLSVICALICCFLSIYQSRVFMLNRLFSCLFTQSLRRGVGFNSSWNSAHCWPHTVAFISLSLSPHLLSLSLTPSFLSSEGSFYKKTLITSDIFSSDCFFCLSVVSLSALLTAQEGVCCLLKLSCARNMFATAQKKQHMRKYTRTHLHTVVVLCWHDINHSSAPPIQSIQMSFRRNTTTWGSIQIPGLNVSCHFPNSATLSSKPLKLHFPSPAVSVKMTDSRLVGFYRSCFNTFMWQTAFLCG